MISDVWSDLKNDGETLDLVQASLFEYKELFCVWEDVECSWTSTIVLFKLTEEWLHSKFKSNFWQSRAHAAFFVY